MLDFNFFNPTQIVFGQKRLDELDNLVPAQAKVMIIYGGTAVKKFGVIDRVKSALKTRKIVEFDKVEPNPKFETLVGAVEVVKAEQVDFLLAVGGGSVMDSTKFIAVAAKTESSEYEALLSHGFAGLPSTEALDLGCVVTLPATGSETNGAGVITLNGQKALFISPILYPKFSFLDSELTMTLPKHQVANGVIDAFVHTIEQYLTFPVGAKVQDRIAEGVLKTLIEDGPVTYRDSSDKQARENFMWCATTAQNGSIGSGVPQDWSTHFIGHELTTLFGIAHAPTLAVVLPSLLRERKDKKRAKLLQYAERVWNISDSSDDEKITKAIDLTEQFFLSLDTPTTLGAYDIDDNGIELILANLEKEGMTALSETGDLGLDTVRKILNMAK
ncbi:iron-containing alcohol dehydrogenase [Vibrio sp. D173a]|uniref:iron-containing alcohol dehydrogenase n=1 Tax=Vibrio sp. D173a TaxID=2836349 RepID=UPI002555FB69|nr:iron-containing alcohol dehydrogenase [Vibrio sp. D173a]MDK9754904.1 iron-containing alcohol dehydrogenase [Vibrio sp. D173a]